MTNSTNSDPDRPARGRRSKLTPAVLGKVITSLRAGNYIETAAEFAGIDRATLFRWLAKGRAARSGQFRDFCDAVEGAIAQAEVAAVARIVTASQADWKAAAWLLERGPARVRWRQSIQLGVGGLSDDEIQEALNTLAQRMAARHEVVG